MTRQQVATLSLENIEQASQASSNEADDTFLCHTYGILIQEDRVASSKKLLWRLADESLIKGLTIRLDGELSEYPSVIPGDIVRIHRVTIDRVAKCPRIIRGRNVVIWRAFGYNPTSITKAVAPTLSPADDDRRRQLEVFYSSLITQVKEVGSDSHDQFYNICGRVDTARVDSFGNLIVTVHDGTGKADVRIFAKTKPRDCGDHFERASKLKEGDYIVVTNVKYHGMKNTFDLSANSTNGKCVRVVERASIMGEIMAKRLEEEGVHRRASGQQEINPSSQPLRRSPRLQQQQQQQQQQVNSSQTTDVQTSSQQSGLSTVLCSQETNLDLTQRDSPEPLPKFTRLSDLKPPELKRFEFHDLIGQVRGQPNMTSGWGNYVFQLYDSSAPKYASFLDREVMGEILPNCVVVLVYSKQRPHETSLHIDKVKELCDGDLVHIINVRLSNVENKLKLELSANLEHGKSITVIDKDSALGSRLMDIVANPLVDELLEE